MFFVTVDEKKKIRIRNCANVLYKQTYNHTNQKTQYLLQLQVYLWGWLGNSNHKVYGRVTLAQLTVSVSGNRTLTIPSVIM